ncbi:MAG: glucose 1-dehydrogenase [Arenicellales bacterium]|jgi:3-oxoacyl-[acyl-carrier protein] reductase|nr:glucose 1-dehydrogenase [Arenicellales bacterium]|tara:strand:- start:1946 stop:2704 length:759 start_codon:yes stop_codon:yes gene_type:complete
MRLKDKVAVVTGAASGFGAGTAELFAAQGAGVVVADISDKAGEAVVESINTSGGRAVYVHADVTSRGDAKRMIQSAKDLGGGLDILVNNAGYSHRNKQFSDVTDEEFDKVYDVNVKAVFIAIQEALPVLRERGGGCIINTSSTAALRPRPGLAVYCSSKGAVSNLTKALAVELAPDKVRVNAICPVIGETGMLETFMGVPDTPENRKKFEATIPLGRFSTPNDIAQTMLFLASDDAAFLTGVALEVDGGRCV